MVGPWALYVNGRCLSIRYNKCSQFPFTISGCLQETVNTSFEQIQDMRITCSLWSVMREWAIEFVLLVGVCKTYRQGQFTDDLNMVTTTKL